MGASALVCHLKTLDWMIVVAFIAGSIGISLYFSRRARKSTKDYFKSGEGLSWWLLGTSMVATTFAADTPLALSGMVVTSGIAQNWYWWCGVPIVMAGVFFLARLWKRANPLTDMEFIQQRYSGKSATFLRGFKALWMSLIHGVIVMGWVNLAMTTVIKLVWPVIPRIPLVDGLMLALFLATPLSRDVKPGVINAVKSGEVRPLEMARDYNLLGNPILWSDIQAGVYKGREKIALGELGILDKFRNNTLISFPETDLPPHLYVPAPSDPGAGTAPQAPSPGDMSWPVTLSDGSVVERSEISGENADNERTLVLGRRALLEKTVETAGGPLKDMTALEFMNEIHNISSSVNNYKILFFLFLITCAYVAIGGLWGVVVTDFFQFWIAMAGCIVLAVLAIMKTGGMEATLQRMVGIYGLDRARAMTALIPTAAGGRAGMMSMYEFFIYAFIIWWAVGFTDGGGSFAQRMLSAEDERHAALGYLWYGVAHFALRMWPWVIVGFAAAVLFPHVPYADGTLPPVSLAEQGYVRTMIMVLPTGLLGLLVAAFLAAYMSTISTIVNLGASYIMNDFYRPFVAPRLEARRCSSGRCAPFRETHYVRMSIVFTLGLAVFGITASLFMNSIKHAWFLLSAMYSGIGLIYILRWYWHRVNAWTEVSCMAALVFFTMTLWFLSSKFEQPLLLPGRMWPFNVLVMAPFSVGVAILVTLMTPPVDREVLKSFCRKVQPGGPGWKEIEEDIRREDPGFRQKSPLTWNNLRLTVLSTITVYCFLFGMGKIILGSALYPGALIPHRLQGVLIIALGLLCGYFVAKGFRKKDWA
ncbi:MAG TPA: Na+:solute symporter [Candidatus Sumerlaeota bacterium]|nr:Na+:solute symporter [Candidatus Sumerlaeota bacterium]